jgi:NlpC/P60 family putative phage cell wall peptidase
MSEQEQRAAVVAEARRWVGTPWRHMADIRGAGVDCAMLLVRVYVGVGLVDPFDPRPYPPDWFLHRSEERFLGFLLDRSVQVEKPEAGDVMLFRVGRCFSHGGIVTETEPLTIVHSFNLVGSVAEEVVARNGLLSREPFLFASFWGSA